MTPMKLSDSLEGVVGKGPLPRTEVIQCFSQLNISHTHQFTLNLLRPKFASEFVLIKV
jgi:hydroxyacyl-ACP dehydratase HTD2-like protein with hotdog domain